MLTTLSIARRFVVALIIAALVAMTVAFGPVALEQVAGVDAGTSVFACQGPGGGC